MKSIIESLLYVAGRPISFKELAKLINQKSTDVEVAVKELIDEYNLRNGGLKIIQNGNQVELVTNPDNAQQIQDFLKEEISGELTPASIETLSIIAYRQPIGRESLEQIRGVNCAIILRNLLIRDLIEEETQDQKTLYRLSLNFFRHLGITDIKELPDFNRLNSIEISSPPVNEAPQI